MRFWKTYGIVLLLVLVAFALRIYQLDFFSLRGDESFTVLFVQKPLAQMWRETLTVEPNPPLLYFALRAWVALAGAGEFATRYLSLAFGVLCVPLLYRLTREMRFPRSAAIVATFLIAINPYQIWHSQDVRNYTLWPLFSLAALLFFWKWYAGRLGTIRESPLPWFVLAELAALYTHYYEAFILLALNVFVFATLWRDGKKLLHWLGAQIVLAVLYLPYPLILSNRVSSYGEGSGRQGVALWDMARETFSAFVLSDTLDENLRAWLWIPFALIALVGLFFLLRRDGKRGLFFILYLGIPTLAVFGLNVFRPLYLERYLNGIAPVYYILLAFGIVELARIVAARAKLPNAKRIVIAAAVGACACVAFFALANYWTNPAYAKAPDWRGLAAIINTNAQRGDLIVQNFPETSLVYYDKTKLPLVVYPETFLPDAKTIQQLNALNSNYQRAWFIPAAPDFWDHEQVVERWLNQHDDLLQTWNTGDLRLLLYQTPDAFLNTMNASDALFGNRLTLRGYRVTREGNALRVALYWQAREKIANEYTIRTQLADANGNVLHEGSNMPVRGELPMTQWRPQELIVDQHDFEINGATQLGISVCATETKRCLRLTAPSNAQGNTLWLPIQP